MKFGQRRRFKKFSKFPRRFKRGKKKFNNFKKRVNKVIESRVERKWFIDPAPGIAITNGNLAFGTMANGGNQLPLIGQGTAEGNRVGNRIRVHKMTYKMTFYWSWGFTRPYVTNTNQSGYLHWVVPIKGQIGNQGTAFNTAINNYVAAGNNFNTLTRLKPTIDSQTVRFKIIKSWRIPAPCFTDFSDGTTHHTDQLIPTDKNNPNDMIHVYKMFSKMGKTWQYETAGDTIPSNTGLSYILVNNTAQLQLNFDINRYVSYTDA